MLTRIWILFSLSFAFNLIILYMYKRNYLVSFQKAWTNECNIMKHCWPGWRCTVLNERGDKRMRHIWRNNWTQGSGIKIYPEFLENQTRAMPRKMAWDQSTSPSDQVQVQVYSKIRQKCNIVQHGGQTNVACWIQQCWTILHQHVASDWLGLILKLNIYISKRYKLSVLAIK